MKTALALLAVATILVACGKNESSANNAPAPAMPSGPATSALRVACDADAAGAEVTVNSQFKGECPLDMQVPAGSFKLVVRKKVGDEKERLFEQEVKLGDGVVKKVEVELGNAQLSGEAMAKLKAAGIEPGKTFRDCPDCPEMVVLPPGEFMMGSPANEQGRSDNEGPQHKVSIAYAFSVGKYEITFDEWDACVAADGCRHKPNDQGWGRGKRPVINVSWNDAQEYVTWLRKKTGKSYRLLSEAEWEYAARAGTSTPFSNGNCITTDQANYNGSGGNYDNCSVKAGINRQKTIEVGSFKPNGFGLHDMHGNVWEWIQDCRHEDYSDAPDDGSAWTSGTCGERVVRGGSWYSVAKSLRIARRYSVGPDFKDDHYGVRLAREN